MNYVGNMEMGKWGNGEMGKCENVEMLGNSNVATMTIQERKAWLMQ